MQTETKSIDDIRDHARTFMIDDLGAITLAWEIPGPPHTSVAWVQCWSMGAGDAGHSRLVIVEIFSDGGFEVFPQICVNGIKETATVIRAMDALESDPEALHQ